MIPLADALWLLSLLAFGWRPNGPLAVLSVSAAFLHLAAGQRRVHLLPSYALIPLLLRAVTTGGMTTDGWYAGRGVAGGLLGGLDPRSVAAGVVGVVLALVALAHAALPVGVELPRPRGPWQVACTTLCLVDHAYESDVNVRFYFPVRAAKAAVRLPLLAHGADTAAGFAYFLHLPTMLLSWLQYAASRVYDAHPDYTEVPEPGEHAAPAGSEDSPAVVPPRFPVLVFSHGLGGTPDCYSTIIADVASHGWVVAAPEHAEGSGAYTKLGDGTGLSYVRMTAAERGDKAAEYRMRHRQLKARVSEMQATLDLVYRLAGEQKPAPAGAPAGAPAAAASKGAAADPEDVQLLKFFLEGRVDAHRLVLAGHSFGAATALATADRDRRALAVVALDPWMFPLSMTTLRHGLAHVPVLSVCGDGFTVWAENAVALRLLLSRGHRAAAAVPPASASGAAPVAAVEGGGESDGEGDGGAAAAPTPAAAAAAAAAAAGSGAAGPEYIARNGVDTKGGVHPGLVHAPSVHAANVLLTVPGIEHQNFNDFAVVMHRALRLRKLIGWREPVAALHLLASLTRAFATQAVAAATGGAAPASASGRSVPIDAARLHFDFVLPPDVAVADAVAHPWTLEQAAAASEPR